MPNEDAQSAESVDETGNGSGWGGAEVVRDHEGRPTGDTSWDGDRVVRDQDEQEATVDAGWSGSEVVKDHGAQADSGGGWSAKDVVRDHGQPDSDR